MSPEHPSQGPELEQVFAPDRPQWFSAGRGYLALWPIWSSPDSLRTLDGATLRSTWGGSMGSAVDYSCAKCGYHVDWMVSGYDVGMASHVAGVRCADCGELHVAALPGKPWDEMADAIVADPVKRGQVPAGTQCPQSPSHQITIWKHPGPCPRCETELQQGDHSILWD